MRANTGARRKLDWLEFDAANLDGGIVLPVTVADLVLVRRLEFENHDFRVPPLLDDFSHDFRFRGVRSGQKLLFVGAHGQHFAKGDSPPTLPGRVSTFTVSPGATRYCLLPLRMTAYIAPPHEVGNHHYRRPPSVRQ